MQVKREFYDKRMFSFFPQKSGICFFLLIKLYPVFPSDAFTQCFLCKALTK